MAKERETRAVVPGKASPPPVAQPSGSVPQVPQRNDGASVPVPMGNWAQERGFFIAEIKRLRDEIQTLKERNNETSPALAPPPSGPALPPPPEEEKNGGCLRVAACGCLVLSVGFFLGFAALVFVLTKLGWSVGDLASQPTEAIADLSESVSESVPLLSDASDGEASDLPDWATSEDAWATVPKPKRGDGWSEDPARTAGESNSFSIDGVDYTFSWAPAGTFKMGSPEDEYQRGNDETLHSVKLTRGFWILQTEVTQAMWQSVMGNNPSFFKGGDFAPEKFPVEGVSWNDAVEFCKKASRMKGVPKGYEFRLPTEAQWEYACRAGSRTPYFWGTDNVDRNSAVNRTRTLQTGDFKANNWNLYDMHGNVREWCVDKYAGYTGDETDPAKAGGVGGVRVCRGGAWNTDYDYPTYGRGCCSAARDKASPDTCEDNLGFRVILVPSQR